MRNVRVADNGFQVSLNTADGRFQLMSDVLCQLAFQAGLLFFLSNIVDGYFERHILKDNAFHGKRASVLVEVHGIPLFLFTEITLVPV